MLNIIIVPYCFIFCVWVLRDNNIVLFKYLHEVISLIILHSVKSPGTVLVGTGKNNCSHNNFKYFQRKFYNLSMLKIFTI